MEPVPKRRKKSDFLKRWTPEDKEKLFALIQEDPAKFERPTAQIFYSNIIKNHPEFMEYGWTSMRDKVRNSRIKYMKAIDWRKNMGSGLQVDDPEIRESILKICPDFYQLDDIFGSKVKIEPKYVCDSEAQDVECTLVEGEEFYSPENNTSSRSSSPAPEPSTLEPESSTPVPGPSSSTARNPRKQTDNAIAFLAEAQQRKIIYLKEKLAMDEKFTRTQLELEREKLELERKKLEFEKEKAKQEFKLKEIELENNFEIQKLKLLQEKELQLYELKLKYNKETDRE